MYAADGREVAHEPPPRRAGAAATVAPQAARVVTTVRRAAGDRSAARVAAPFERPALERARRVAMPTPAGDEDDEQREDEVGHGAPSADARRAVEGRAWCALGSPRRARCARRTGRQSPWARARAIAGVRAEHHQRGRPRVGLGATWPRPPTLTAARSCADGQPRVAGR